MTITWYTSQCIFYVGDDGYIVIYVGIAYPDNMSYITAEGERQYSLNILILEQGLSWEVDVSQFVPRHKRTLQLFIFFRVENTECAGLDVQ